MNTDIDFSLSVFIREPTQSASVFIRVKARFLNHH